MPSSKLLAGDLQLVHVSTNDNTSTRTADVYFRQPVNRTVMVGDRIERPTVSTIARENTLRLRARFTVQPHYDKLTSIVYEQTTTSALVALSMTSAYATLSGGYDLDVPDLSAVSGFDASRALQPGKRLDWFAARFGGTLPLGRNPVAADGTIRRTSATQDAIASP